tara:strand:- start:804 stop:1220 length:417 start_codon:yes stop_codon:yes gene_type:complete
MEFRRALTGDFLAIAALDREAWKQGAAAEFIPDGEHAWRIWIEHAEVFCAEIDGGVVGAVVAFPCKNGSYCLHKVFVDVTCRAQGIGSQLFDQLLEEIDKKKSPGVSHSVAEQRGGDCIIRKVGFHRTEIRKGLLPGK